MRSALAEMAQEISQGLTAAMVETLE